MSTLALLTGHYPPEIQDGVVLQHLPPQQSPYNMSE